MYPLEKINGQNCWRIREKSEVNKAFFKVFRNSSGYKEAKWNPLEKNKGSKLLMYKRKK